MKDNERDVYVAAHTTTEVKAAIKAISRTRKISISALVHQILRNSPEVKAIVETTIPQEITR